MCCNQGKTVSIHFSLKYDQLETSHNRFLGLLLNSQSNWKQQIVVLTKKLASEYELKKAYTGLFQSQVTGAEGIPKEVWKHILMN